MLMTCNSDKNGECIQNDVTKITMIQLNKDLAVLFSYSALSAFLSLMSIDQEKETCFLSFSVPGFLAFSASLPIDQQTFPGRLQTLT